MNTKNRKYIGIFGAPRTGSNLLHHLLLGNRLSFGLFEIFHHKLIMPDHEVYIENQFSSFEKFREHCLLDPIGTLDLVYKNIPNPLFVFKIFPEHLDEASTEILAQKCHSAILLKRNILTSWISDQIASASSDYVGYQDRDIKYQSKVEWNISKFIDWSVHVLKFMKQSESILKINNVPILDTTYEEINSMQSNPALIWNQLSTVCCYQFEAYFDNAFDPQIRKQNSAFVLDKFTEPDKVEEELFTLDLHFLLADSDKYATDTLLDLLSRIQYENGFYGQ